MTDDIAQWLEGLGLGRYAGAFAESDIDFEVLPRLTEDNLKELGLTLGHRVKLRAAIETLVDDHLPPKPDTSGAQEAEAERRQLTVLFADLVGSTALSARLDPEDMREILRDYQETCSKVIARYDGYVAKFMGDGVYAYFGYPSAHEDDAERAINAGLGIVEAVGALEHELHVRVGVATGTVAVGDIVGEGASEEAAIVGDTPNLAARLLEVADADAVVIDRATHVLAGGLFEMRDLGAHHLKGFAEPVLAWTVDGARRADSRFEATRGENLFELVGRDEELQMLKRRWQRAKAGEGQVVLVAGEAGIGKSRLARELMERISYEPHIELHFQCSAYHTNSALYPVVEHLERAALFEDSDQPDTKRAKLEALVAQSGRPAEQTLPLIAPLLSLPVAPGYLAFDGGPQRQRELTLIALVDYVSGLAKQQPVLVVFEDVHLVDPTTMEWLELMVERVPKAPVLMLLTHRPEFQAPWIGRPRVTAMILGRLEQRDCAAMVEKVWAREGIPKELRDRIADQADGVPLFAEELTKAVYVSRESAPIGSADEPAMGVTIPLTLQDALEARLDRLGHAREITQICAAIGRTFDYRLLSRLSPVDADALDAALDELVAAGLLTVRGTPPNAAYTFKHALIQETAYQSLLRRRRAEIHGRIGASLEQAYPEIVQTEPETVAYHYTEAGHHEAAVAYWLQAGQRAAERSADVEARRHLESGLRLLRGLPDGIDRDARELDILIALGPVLMNLRGSASDEVRELYFRARELCASDVQPAKRFPVVWGLWLNRQISGDPEGALQIADEAIAVAEELPDNDLLLQAHHSAWTSQMFLADFRSAARHTDQGLTLYELERHRQQIFTYGGHDPGVCAGSLSAHALWFLGFPDQALERSNESISLAKRTAHPISVAHALNFSAMLRLLRREYDAAAQLSDELVELSVENGLAIWRANGAVLRGWARTATAPSARDLDEFREAVRQREGSGSRVRLSIHLAALAYALSSMGEEAEARRVIVQALRELDETGERWWEALVHWFNGEITASGAQRDTHEAEACYLLTRDVAHRQEARSMELRAATSLASLWHTQGKTAEARDLLAPVYSWFTEGFDTADLKEAKVLLNELS